MHSIETHLDDCDLGKRTVAGSEEMGQEAGLINVILKPQLILKEAGARSETTADSAH